MNEEKPYIEKVRTVIDREYNPNYGDDRTCECGHPYYRHFDTYEDMYPCGCKYCSCDTFVELTKMSEEDRRMYELSFQRPKNFFQLSEQEQWEIDKTLGILDWTGVGLSEEEQERYLHHYINE